MNTHSKYDHILETACKLFLTEGFHKVSVDRIVSAACVSKPTLYAHFKDKNDLFRAVIEMRTQRLLSRLEASFAEQHSIEDFLFHYGRTYLEIVMSDEAVSMFRTITAQTQDFPEMAELFYGCGPHKAFGYFTQHIATLHQAGTLYAPNPEMSADMFISTLKGKYHLKRLLGLCPAPTPDAITQRTQESVRLFLAAHAPTLQPQPTDA